MRRWLRDWLCRHGLHIACEHRPQEEHGRTMERLRQRRRAIDERMERVERARTEAVRVQIRVQTRGDYRGDHQPR